MRVLTPSKGAGRWSPPHESRGVLRGGANSQGLCHHFFAGLKIETLIYQCFYFTKTAKNAIFSSLPLRSGYNSDKLRFNAWFYDFPYSSTWLTKGSTSSKSSAFACLGVSTRSRSLFLRHRQQKCRKLATKCHPRLNRREGIDIMPRNRYSLGYDHLP